MAEEKAKQVNELTPEELAALLRVPIEEAEFIQAIDRGETDGCLKAVEPETAAQPK